MDKSSALLLLCGWNVFLVSGGAGNADTPREHNSDQLIAYMWLGQIHLVFICKFLISLYSLLSAQPLKSSGSHC